MASPLLNVGRSGSLGKYFIRPFKDEIKKMVDAGTVDKGKRWSNAKMLEQLKRTHFDRYDRPATHQITNCVKTYLKKEREKKAVEAGTMPAKNPRSGMKE